MTETAPGRPLWPALRYEDFAPTMHLLHMGLQMVGKLTLLKPFEPQWANVALGLTSTGLTTGPIPWQGGTFTVDAAVSRPAVGGPPAGGGRGGGGGGARGRARPRPPRRGTPPSPRRARR